MSSEEWRERMERQMAFIVEQQAQSEVRWVKADERWAKADERWAHTEEGIRALLAIAEIHEGEFAELRESGLRVNETLSALSEAGSATDERLSALSEAALATDERLSVLINVVERQITEGRNGKS